MASNILFSLYNWKFKRKSFELIIRLPCKDSFGWNDYYTIYFVINKSDRTNKEYNKTLAQHTNRRFFQPSNDFINFGHILNFHPEALRKFQDFHYWKIDILGLKVLNII